MSTTVHLQLLTTSSEKCFGRCPRQYLHKYEQGIRAIRKADTLRFGSLIHQCLEIWWLEIARMQTYGHRGRPLGLVEEQLDSELRANRIDAFEHVRATEMMRGYHFRWFDNALNKYEVLGVEVEFRASLKNPDTGGTSHTFLRAGKIDLTLKRCDTGRIFVVEHKTSTEDIGPGSDYWTKLTMDTQISRYLVGARSLGIDATSCLYDVLRRPTILPKLATPVESRKYTKPTKADPTPRLYKGQRETDESPEEYGQRIRDHIAANPELYYQRGEVVRLDKDRLEADRDCWQIGRAIRDAQLHDRWPRNPDACIRFGRKCEYFGVCSGTASLSDPTMFERTPAHSELNTEAATAAE